MAVSGCVSPHSVLVTEDGKAMTFGRNQYGQLGIGNTTLMDNPTIVPALQEMNVIAAATGRNHTLFLTDTGTVYACGDNRSGQCGVGNLQPTILSPTRINYRGPPIVKVNTIVLQCSQIYILILGWLWCGFLCHLGHQRQSAYFRFARIWSTWSQY